mgnify:CR=1 FL=1
MLNINFMEEKDSYSSIEVAQICEASLRIYGRHSTTAKEIEKYERFIPKKVREDIDRLKDAIQGFYMRSQNPKQRDSLADLESRLQSSKDFEEFLRLHGMID